ncbi:T9SS type A sorting domain-containing protein [Sphingobacteriaceae bacterium AH-315-L07]|nr:T9SS type A sorting domain-containing protein [Sphingobacteriaceae bacterium AH-315-L07]
MVVRIVFNLFLIFLFLSNNTSIGATITATGSGDWDSTTEDAPWPGGTVPADTDDIVTDNNTITVTATAKCASIDLNPQGGGGSPTITVNTGITLTVTGNVVLRDNNGGSTATLTLNGTAVLKVGGNFTNHANAVVTAASGSTVEFTSTSSQTLTSATDAFGNLTLSGSGGTYTLQDVLDVNGDLTITNGTLATGNYNINVAGHWSNSDVFTQGTGTVEFDGGANQDILGSSTTTFHDLKINNSSGDVDVTVNTTVDGTLTLTTGDIVVASGKLLTIEDVDDPGISGGSTSTMIVGPVKKKYSSTTAITIPVGNGTKYLPVLIAPNDANATHWQVEYKASAHATSTTCQGDVGIKYISNIEHHFVDRTSGTTDATVRLYWDASSNVTEAEISSLRIAHYNSGDDCWDLGNATVSTNTTDDWIEAAITTFSPFTLASNTNGEHTTLPIKLLDFSAETDGQLVRLKWSTASEIDNDYFTIERSEDGLNFEVIHLIDGAGNSFNQIDYTVVDEAPIDGISYYRLKQTDFDGQFEYFPVVSVNVKLKQFDLSGIYPNPAKNNVIIEFTAEEYDEVTMSLYNLMGQELIKKNITTKQGMNELGVDISNLTEGTYFIVMINQNNAVITSKLSKNNSNYMYCCR